MQTNGENVQADMVTSYWEKFYEKSSKFGWTHYNNVPV